MPKDRKGWEQVCPKCEGGMMNKYRHLEENEIIREGDEVDMCNDGWRDNPVWEKATCIGEKAPNPSYPSHRVYRRLIKK